MSEADAIRKAVEHSISAVAAAAPNSRLYVYEDGTFEIVNSMDADPSRKFLALAPTRIGYTFDTLTEALTSDAAIRKHRKPAEESPEQPQTDRTTGGDSFERYR